MIQRINYVNFKNQSKLLNKINEIMKICRYLNKCQLCYSNIDTNRHLEHIRPNKSKIKGAVYTKTSMHTHEQTSKYTHTHKPNHNAKMRASTQ